MKVSSISLSNYSNPSGTLIILGADSTAICLNLTQDEAQKLFSLGLTIFEARQASIAKSIADMKVAALPSPEAFAEYEEVPDAETSDDETPF